MRDTCDHCDSTNIEHHHAWGETETAPAECAGWECMDCGYFMEDEDATPPPQ